MILKYQKKILFFTCSSSDNLTPPISWVLIGRHLNFCWRHQSAVTRLENIRQLNTRRGKKLGFQLSQKHPFHMKLLLVVDFLYQFMYQFLSALLILNSRTGNKSKIAQPQPSRANSALLSLMHTRYKIPGTPLSPCHFIDFTIYPLNHSSNISWQLE